jgi:hypothetical protein
MLKAWPDAYLFGFTGSSDAWSLWGEGMAPHPSQDLAARLAQRKLRPSVETVIVALDAIKAGKLPWRPGILISDLSLLVDVDVDDIEAEYGKGWDMWAAVLRRVRMMRDRARAVGMVVAVNGHDAQQKEVPGHPDHIRGGIKLASHKARAEFHKMTDMNIRVVNPSTKDGPFAAWPSAYRVENDESWFEKDRWNKIAGVAPMNLRELLIASPHPMTIPRRKGLEWVDEEADKVVAAVQAGASILEASEDLESTLLAAGRDPGAAYMAAYDGACRAWLRTARRARFTSARERAASSLDGLFTPAPEPAKTADKPAEPEKPAPPATVDADWFND